MYKTNIYKYADNHKKHNITTFAEGYKAFLSLSKTERLTFSEIERMAKENGFKEYDAKSSLSKGDKIYFVNRQKNIILYKIGTQQIINGMQILGAHLDSPRLDLKQSPLYEANDLALFDTHYYGSLKNYQYVVTPMAVHGVVYKKDGTHVDINIGESETDPIVGISDVLVHLASDQLHKVGNKIIESEDLDVIIGSICSDGNQKGSVKNNILKALANEYGICEEDFLSAELEVVPACKARDFGFDRSMIAGYGQDDRACVYAVLKAIIDIENCEYTACALFVDKEEVGNCGATGAESIFFENTILELLRKSGDDSIYNLRKTLSNSYMLICDAVSAIDPIYSSVSDSNNCAKLNYGVAFEKYVGYGGKCGTNDANPRYIASIRNFLDSHQIFFQFAEFGKVDQGGGGTTAYIAAKQNIEVMDCGIPMLNMHSPMEIIAKADLYEAYQFYKLFFSFSIK